MSIRQGLNVGAPLAQWLLLAAVLLLVGSGMGAHLCSDHGAIDAEQRARLESYGKIVDDNLSVQLRSTSNVLKSIRSELPYLSAQKEGVAFVNRRLKSMSDGMPGVRTLLVLDASGTVSASNREELIGQNFREREYFRIAHKGGNAATLYVAPPFKTALGAFAVTLAMVITDERGAFSGIVTATLDPEYFSTLLNSILYAPDARASIIHSDGTVFVSSPHLPGVDGMTLAKPGTFFIRHQESGQRSSLFTGTVYATGDERMMHQRTGEKNGLALDRPFVFAVSRDLTMIFADWHRDTYAQAGGFGLLVLIASSGLYLYQKRQRAYDRLLAIQEAERKQADEALRKSEARFRQTFERNDSVMLLIDPRSGEISDANAAAAQFYGYSIELLKTMRIQQVNMLSPDEVADSYAQMARRERNFFIFPHRLADGSVRTVEVRSSPIEVGNSCLLFSIIHDITERKQMEERIRDLAFFDPLTQLPNRRLLNDRLNQTMAANKRSGSYGALMFLDLDNFKPLNDAHGHEIGDLLLMEVSNRLKGCVRDMDTVARFGGDEFVVMISELVADKSESASQGGVIAEKIRASLAKPYVLEVRQEETAKTTVEHHCTASIGISLFSKNDSCQEDVLKRADAAMYQAKEAGRNLIRFYDVADA